MRIGSDDNYLSVEKVSEDGPTVRWRIEATVADGSWRFSAVHDDIRAASPDDTLPGMAEFEANKIQRFEMLLLGGGWLRIKRDPNGCVLVRYRIGQVSVGAALEGAIILQREAAEQFCQEFKRLI